MISDHENTARINQQRYNLHGLAAPELSNEDAPAPSECFSSSGADGMTGLAEAAFCDGVAPGDLNSSSTADDG